MSKRNTSTLTRFSKTLMEDMFKVKKGDTVAITADSGSSKEIVEALAKASEVAGAIPLTMWMPTAKEESQAGMKYWPSEALKAALCHVDVWIEAQSMVILYSDIWETAMKNNDKLRYLIIANSSIESLDRVFTGFDIQLLKKLLNKVRHMVMSAKTIRIVSENGTDVSYETNLDYAFDIDDGDYSQPKFGTAPGFVNIVPKVDSMNGVINFDLLQNSDPDHQLQFVMKKGVISEIKGEETSRQKFEDYLASFHDDNMYKISHNMIGLNPKVRALTGELVEDERIWGGVDFGFGHTSALDMPPFGQEAKSHFDGVVTDVSIYLDDMLVINNGVVIHKDLRPVAEQLLQLNL